MMAMPIAMTCAESLEKMQADLLRINAKNPKLRAGDDALCRIGGRTEKMEVD